MFQVILKSNNSNVQSIKTAMKVRQLVGKNSKQCQEDVSPKNANSAARGRDRFNHCEDALPSSEEVQSWLEAIQRLLEKFAITSDGDSDEIKAAAESCGHAADHTKQNLEYLAFLAGPGLETPPPLQREVSLPDTPKQQMRIPFKRVPTFTGRKPVIDDAVSVLSTGRPVLLWGIPGIGKTVTAIEVAVTIRGQDKSRELGRSAARTVSADRWRLD